MTAHCESRRERWIRRRQAWIRRVGIKPFLTWRLHRRIFLWIGLTMIATAVTVGSVMSLANRVNGGDWHHDIAGAQGFLAAQFGKVWDTPSSRDALAQELAHALDARVELRDASGASLSHVGEPCSHAFAEAPVVRDGHKLGSIRVCADRYAPRVWKIVVPIGLTLFVLWLAAGGIARRLMRPMNMVLEMAEQLGRGNLKSRAPTSGFKGGEERTFAEALNKMADRIERQMADQRELLAQVSHELRTPLGHIRLLIELARDAGAHKAADELEKEVAEIDALVGDLLASSRVTFEALSVRELDASELAARALERAGLSADKLRADGDAKVVADATLVMRALANLLENAKGHAGGVEALSVSRDGGQVRFTVIDRGPGFAEGDQVHAFDPFFHRPRAENGESGSLGLGLALVQRIAAAHGGSAAAKNRPGGGAEVSFTVRADGPVREADSRPQPAASV